jgi:hypothetical protein
MNTLAEEIFKTIEFFLEDNNIGLMVFPRETVADLTGRIVTTYEAKLKEDLQTPIEDGLYATGRFTPDECSVLAEGLLIYINDYLKQRTNG